MTETMEAQDAQEPTSKGELLLRDQIKAAMEETRSKDVPATETATEPRASPGTDAARDLGGRFSKTDRAGAEPPNDPTPTKVDVKPPARWSSDAKTKFASLDSGLQQEILRRETEMERAAAHIDDERALGRQIREMSAPYEAILRAENATPALAYRDYLNTAYQLRTASPQQKAAMLLALARQFNVPLASASGPAQAVPAFDPRSLGPMIRDTVNQGRRRGQDGAHERALGVDQYRNAGWTIPLCGQCGRRAASL